MSAVHEHNLSNGMTILCCPQKHLHSMEFSLFLKGGSLYENRQNQGICHLLEHLCFRGLGQWDAEGLNRLMARFGAELNGMLQDRRRGVHTDLEDKRDEDHHHW